MPTYQYPAVYVAEVEAQVRPIEGVFDLDGGSAWFRMLRICERGRERLPPNWTDAKRGDPGIALLELVAWISESLLYRGGPDAQIELRGRCPGLRPRRCSRCRDVAYPRAAP